MSFLTKSSRVKELETKASNWDNLVTSVLQADSTLTVEQITPKMIVDALSADNTDTSDAAALATANSRIAELLEENTNLRGSAAADPASIKSDAESSAKAEAFSDFCTKNKGDHAAILEAAKKEGIIT